MDASQYKDYVLVLLFVKYVSDKYETNDFWPIAKEDQTLVCSSSWWRFFKKKVQAKLIEI
jgi:type I restriction-modification system DNA methylase subunit